MRTSLLFALFLFFVSCTFGAEPSVPNPGFEIGNGTTAAQWSWWSRAKTGAAERTTMEPHGGRYAMHIRHEARGDWAFSSTGRVAVRPGQGFRATGWVKVKTGEVALGIVALSKGQTLDWDLGSQGESGAGKSEAGRWVQLQSIAEIPEGCDQIYLRFTGLGVADLVLDDVSLVPADLPKLSPALSAATQGRRICAATGPGATGPRPGCCPYGTGQGPSPMAFAADRSAGNGLQRLSPKRQAIGQGQ